MNAWECPVCHVGVAGWVAVCPECKRRKEACEKQVTVKINWVYEFVPTAPPIFRDVVDDGSRTWSTSQTDNQKYLAPLSTAGGNQ